MEPTSLEEVPPQETESRLIVILKTKTPAKDVPSLQAALASHNATLKLLFGQDEHRLRKEQEEVLKAAIQEQQLPPTEDELEYGASSPLADEPEPDMACFYYVDGPQENLKGLAAELNQQDSVDGAYITPPASLALYVESRDPPRAVDVPAQTPDFTPRQIYLGPAPAGIDAKFAHTVPGGTGEQMKVVDCEWGWRFTHEDLKMLQGGVLAGSNSTDVGSVNHGTAVSGVISGDVNNFGIRGIAPDAVFYGSSLSGQLLPTAIKAAADKLGRGDVIVMAIHRPGPNSPNPPQGQKGYIAVEFWPEVFTAIRFAINKGIVVVEAAGNGFENLDAAIYDKPLVGFPPSWRNPFNLRNPSSGAIIVGAGCPPPGVHGHSHGPDRSRLDFSNYGSRVDCQGWGREVTSTGYGDLQAGGSQDLWYTDVFNGTSSASPMVAGTALCVQGIRKKRNRNGLTSPTFRTLLRRTGSRQEPSPTAPVSQRIGRRPDLRQLIPAALNIP